MIFTQEQINEIRERLLISGKKDTQFSPVSLPMSGEEIIAITQDGESKKVPIGTFYDEFSRYIDKSERVDLLNVSRYAQQTTQVDNIVPLTLEEAIAICPNDVKRGGQILTFLDQQSNTWTEWQYKGTTKDGWNDITNWVQNTAGIVSVNSEGVAIDNAGRKWQFTRYIETYVTPSSDWTYDSTTKPLAITNPEYTIYWANSVEALVESTDTTIPTAKNAGTYTKYWKVKDMGGYAGTTGSIQVTVAKKDVSFTSQGSTKTYDGNNITASTEVTVNGALSGDVFEASAIGSAGPNAGTYPNTITITSSPVDASTNYAITKNEGSLIINRATRTLTWVLGKNPPSTAIDVGTQITVEAQPSVGSGTITYHFGSTTNTTGIYTPSSGGTLQVWASITQDTNYASTETAKTNVVVNALPNIYAVDTDIQSGIAPAPSTIADITTPNSGYTSGNFTNGQVLDCSFGGNPGRFIMSWFAIPSNKNLSIKTTEEEDLTGLYTPTIIGGYKVYIQTDNIGAWTQNSIRLTITN